MQVYADYKRSAPWNGTGNRLSFLSDARLDSSVALRKLDPPHLLSFCGPFLNGQSCTSPLSHTKGKLEFFSLAILKKIDYLFIIFF